MTDNIATDSSLADDLLRGEPAISAFLGFPKRKTYHLIQQRSIPCFKLGGRWHARKSVILAHFEKLEGEG